MDFNSKMNNEETSFDLHRRMYEEYKREREELHKKISSYQYFAHYLPKELLDQLWAIYKSYDNKSYDNEMFRDYMLVQYILRNIDDFKRYCVEVPSSIMCERIYVNCPLNFSACYFADYNQTERMCLKYIEDNKDQYDIGFLEHNIKIPYTPAMRKEINRIKLFGE